MSNSIGWYCLSNWLFFLDGSETARMCSPADHQLEISGTMQVVICADGVKESTEENDPPPLW